MSDLTQIFGNSFNLQSVEPQGDFDVLPPGKYLTLIERAKVDENKNKNGEYVKLTLRVMDGQFKNRVLFDYINIRNPNTQCVEIGLKVLSALRIATNLENLTDTDQLVNQIVMSHVKVDKSGQNSIRTYSDAGAASSISAPPAVTTSPTAQPKPTSSTQTSRKPWDRDGDQMPF